VPRDSNASPASSLRSLGALSAVGFSLVLAVVLGAAAGYGLDAWLGSSPWGFLIGFFLGLAAGMRTVFRTVAAVSQREDDRR
jgi:ATP synthase protein I